MPSFTIMALNFHSTQQVSKNSLVHALIKQLKYLQIQNTCFCNRKVHLRITVTSPFASLFPQVVNVDACPHAISALPTSFMLNS